MPCACRWHTRTIATAQPSLSPPALPCVREPTWRRQRQRQRHFKPSRWRHPSSSSTPSSVTQNPKVRLYLLASLSAILSCAAREGPLPAPFRMSVPLAKDAGNDEDRLVQRLEAEIGPSTASASASTRSTVDDSSDDDHDEGEGGRDGDRDRDSGSAPQWMHTYAPAALSSHDGNNSPENVFTRVGLPAASLKPCCQTSFPCLKRQCSRPTRSTTLAVQAAP